MALKINGVTVAGIGGLSDYDMAVAAGFVGTREEFAAALAKVNRKADEGHTHGTVTIQKRDGTEIKYAASETQTFRFEIDVHQSL